jgi:CheY-like chemotaxis protein
VISRDVFARHVRDALANLYDPVRLQNHPLGNLLNLQQNPGETRAEALRRMLRETIETLKPEASVPAKRQEWLGYRVLWLHHIRSLSQAETCRELGISEATFFRHQREALEAVVAILWERQASATHPPQANGVAREDALAEQTLERALALVSSEPAELVDLRTLLDDLQPILEPLAVQRGMTLQRDMPIDLPPVHGHVPILRQMLLDLLAEGIQFYAGGVIRLSARVVEHEMIWRLCGSGVSQTAEGLERREVFSAVQKLLGLYEGRLWLEKDAQGCNNVCLAFRLPTPRIILVIDDDPGAVELYRRYLQSYDCVLLGAHTAEQVEAALAGTLPDLILLDVIMPHQDGWTILQDLKRSPRTAHIPVIVCSVIPQPRLALALGAAEVLNKPFTPADLVRIVQDWLTRAGSADSARPATP